MLYKNNFPFLVAIVLSGFLIVFTIFLNTNAVGLAKTTDNQHSYLPLVNKPENTPTITPIPTLAPKPTLNPNSDWLSYINFMRNQVDIPEVTSNENWSNGCWLHSRYMVMNDQITHNEDPNNPWYTLEGNEAAEKSNVMVSSSTKSTDMYAIDIWMSGPFHGVAIIDPQLKEVGFGSYREAVGRWQMGASLDVSRGRISSEPPNGTYPVMWPGDGQSTNILGYQGTEWPDPLTSCPDITADFRNPSGPPIILQIGSGNKSPNVSTTSFKQGSTNLEHCVFDETNYTNPNSSTQNTGRLILGNRDAIIIMPKQPLEVGKSYSVTITTNGRTYAWSFIADSYLQMSIDLPSTLTRAR